MRLLYVDQTCYVKGSIDNSLIQGENQDSHRYMQALEIEHISKG